MLCRRCRAELRLRARNGRLERFCPNRICAEFGIARLLSPLEISRKKQCTDATSLEAQITNESLPETADDISQATGKNPT